MTFAASLNLLNDDDELMQLTAKQQQQLEQQQQQISGTANKENNRYSSNSIMGSNSQRPISTSSGSNVTTATPQTPINSLLSRPSSGATRPQTSISDELTTSTTNTLEAAGLGQQAGILSKKLQQCRICRKQLNTGNGGQANEPVHLCSNCQQLICDDCASYSASDQHWMCSSCRRRALNPPIPTEALKELGLNQSSAPFRRMTLRLNQNDLKMAAQKGSSESTNSSNSSSGCSSMSAHHANAASIQSNAQANATNLSLLRQATSGDHRASLLSEQQIASVLQQRPKLPNQRQNLVQNDNIVAQATENASSLGAAAAKLCIKPAQNCLNVTSNKQNLSQQTEPAVVFPSRNLAAQKTMSNPSATLSLNTSPTKQGLLSALSAQQSHSETEVVFPKRHATDWSASRISDVKQTPFTGSLTRSENQQQQSLRSSIAGDEPTRTGGSTSLRRASAMPSDTVWRSQLQQRQSVASVGIDRGQRGSQSISIDSEKRSESQDSNSLMQQPKQHLQDARIMAPDNHYRNSIACISQQQQPVQHESRVAKRQNYQQQAPQQVPINKLIRFGSSDLTTGESIQRASSSTAQRLIPMSQEQMHMRRLSDQSNLVRRSSIINSNDPSSETGFMAGLGDSGTLAGRNRSHSNIDSVGNYFATSGAGNFHSLAFQSQSQQQQHHHTNKHNWLQQNQPHMQYNSRSSGGSLTVSDENIHRQQYQHQHQQQQQQQHLNWHQQNHQLNLPQMQQRRLSDQWDERQRSLLSERQQQELQGFGQLYGNQQRRQFQASQPQLMSSIITSYTQKKPRSSAEELSRSNSSSDGEMLMAAGQCNHDDVVMMELDSGVQHSISGNNRHYQQQQQQHPVAIPSVSVSEFSHRRNSMAQKQVFTTDQIDPMQINVAVEQVIQQQQLQEQQQQRHFQQLQQAQLFPQFLPIRRGSSGRVLPQIPNQQSRSLLELPANSGGAGGSLLNIGGPGGLATNSFHQAASTLDLPSASPTIRRASAPEGQNIKIVVDDIDSSAHLHHHQHNYHFSAMPQQRQATMFSGGVDGCTLLQAGNQVVAASANDNHHHHLEHNHGQNQQQRPACYQQQQQQHSHGHQFVPSRGPHYVVSLGGQTRVSGGAGQPPAGEFYERHILYRDDSLALDHCIGTPTTVDSTANGLKRSKQQQQQLQAPTTNQVGREFGLQVMGGKLNGIDGKLRANITWVLPGGPADKVGLNPGDQIIEWDGKCLLNMSYEQVAELIESSANIAEVLVKPQVQVIEPGANYVRSARRLSQQTERDLRQLHEQQHQQQRQQLTDLLSSQYKASELGLAKQQQQQQQQQQQPQSSSRQTSQGTQRAGTGRKLPQIPPASTTNQHHLAQPPFNPQRHASTGQLEHTGLAKNYTTTRLIGGSANSTGEATPLTGAAAAMANTTGAKNLLSATNDQQHQSRSAGELHRASISSLLASSNISTHSAGNAQPTPQHLYQPAQQLPAAMQQHQQQQQYHRWPQHYGGSQIISDQVQGVASDRMQNPVSQQRLLANDFVSSNGCVFEQAPSHSINALTETEPCGLIGLQVRVDERMATLEISILSAHNIVKSPNLDYVVKINILPESNLFKPCSTHPSSDMNWMETFLFQNVPIPQVHRMAIEIGIWLYDEAPRLSAQTAQPICEALIPIQSARERHIDFWPLRPSASSPQTRRKSLNDLISNHYASQAYHEQHSTAAQYSGFANEQTGARFTMSGPRYQSQQQQELTGNASHRFPSDSSGTGPVSSSGQRRQSTSNRISPNDSPQRKLNNNNNNNNILFYQRERSASNRNLPDTNKPLQIQPRRASDEVAASSSHRLLARNSPTTSRRSISVINVGDGHSASTMGASRSRLGSQTNILKSQLRRDSANRFQQANSNQQLDQHSGTGSRCASPTKYGSPSGGSLSMKSSQKQQPQQAQQSQQQQQQVGITPSGRRSSLVGIQSMSCYRSQKNSQSDATDTNESPLHSIVQQQQIKRTREPLSTPLASAGQQNSLTGQPRQQQRAVKTQSVCSSGRPSCSSILGSRRGSASICLEQTGAAHQHAQLQRRGSFAMQTLRKLKRTMSLSKGNEGSQPGSNQGSRRVSSSSSSSNHSELDTSQVAEDLAVARTPKSDTIVGRLKLSFSLSKGQFEVEVICAQGLVFEHESAMGLYVKMHLKGKNKTNKRKTRLVEPWESPLFKQTIKYDGSLVDNKLLEISVWVKLSSLRGKQAIGFTEICIKDLNLGPHLQTTTWYNLRSMDTLSSSSIDG